MYTVIGIKPDGGECKPLEYPTLAEAMKKLQNLIEADELDVEGGQPAMFVQYTMIPNLPPPPPPDSDSPSDHEPPHMPTYIPPPAPNGFGGKFRGREPEPGKPSLRLVQ